MSTLVYPPVHTGWVLAGLVSVLLSLAAVWLFIAVAKAAGAAASTVRAAVVQGRIRRPCLHLPILPYRQRPTRSRRAHHCRHRRER